MSEHTGVVLLDLFCIKISLPPSALWQAASKCMCTHARRASTCSRSQNAPNAIRTGGGLGLFFRPKLLLALRQSLGAFFSAQLHLWHSDGPSGAGKLLEEEHLNSLLSVVWFQVLAHTRKVSPSVNCSVSSLEVQKLKSERRCCHRLLILIICLWRLMYMKKKGLPLFPNQGEWIKAEGLI